jgi:hypothetical protein
LPVIPAVKAAEGRSTIGFRYGYWHWKQPCLLDLVRYCNGMK